MAVGGRQRERTYVLELHPRLLAELRDAAKRCVFLHDQLTKAHLLRAVERPHRERFVARRGSSLTIRKKRCLKCVCVCVR